MKKRMFSICMAAMMLTGCGSAGSASDHKNGKAESNAHPDEELDYTEMEGIDIPRPVRMKNGALGESFFFASHSFDHYHYDDVDDVVFYSFFGENPSLYSGLETFKDEPLEELLKDVHFLDQNYKYLRNAYGSYTSDDLSLYSIDSEEEKEMLGYKVKRYSGLIELKDGRIRTDGTVLAEPSKIHYILDLAYVDNEGVVWWMTFTKSDAQSEQDEMQYLADLPLSKAKIHETA